ncbi:serine-threonine protein kinase, putative [Entamoeba invadens IP1]|uniref:Serine-threonine protein kinase, putative n=1 Tax=Entamoeba invadens IP1 TaxID=370355 RepID=A0A0A1UAC3_ENTIV|nr:serine-threonine protein kinase, putative [Entamoeba invadens IP1]ELP90126.1 serine-threonine protein kinase, putative [Entamoeba invadens IP1]|eukprot:XP_004256897.1 serine-threonine protein kinase, putative [Entamoeba invadens IP1]
MIMNPVILTLFLFSLALQDAREKDTDSDPPLECLCNNGYHCDENGICVMDCLFPSCVGGCISPNECGVCDGEGIESDCNKCKSGYSWGGYGICVPTPKKTSCVGGVKEGKEIVFQRKENGTNVVKEIITIENIVYSENICSKVVDPRDPGAYGGWVQLSSDISGYVSVSTRGYNEDTIEHKDFLKQVESDDLFFATQKSCQEEVSESCFLFSAGTSKYIHSPHLVFYLTQTPLYLFVHHAFGESFNSSFPLYVEQTEHPCLSFSQLITLPEDLNVVKHEIDFNNFVFSSSSCISNPINTKWFRVVPSFHTILLSLCESSFTGDLSIQVIRSNFNSSTVKSCDYENSKCVSYVSGNCGTKFKYSKMILPASESDITYYVGIVSHSTVSVGQIVLSTSLTCVSNCNNHGICSSYMGSCVCEDKYVLRQGTCTMCGNGQIDPFEECDNSVFPDPNCGEYTCLCNSGRVPKNFTSGIYCVIPTCGNGQIDEGEECDGGDNCFACRCVNNTHNYANPQKGCLTNSCGNNILDDGEECDGGTGCYECQCQTGYIFHNNTSCRESSFVANLVIYFVVSIVIYYILYGTILLFILIGDRQLKKAIRKDLKECEILQNITGCGSIPFVKTNAARVAIDRCPFFHFSDSVLDYLDQGKIDLNKKYHFCFTLRNTTRTVMLYTFHSRDNSKYQITFEPFVGILRSNEVVTVKASLVMFCTSNLNEKVHVTFKYGKIHTAVVEISRIFDIQKNEKCDNENEVFSASSEENNRNSFSALVPNKDKPPNPKEEMYVVMKLRAESKLSTKLDFDEIEIKQPPVGKGSFGLVYRGYWRGLEVAVKMLKSDMFDTEALLPSFQEECNLMERMRCPYILGFIGSVTMPDQLCVITEFCPLFSLRKYMKTNYMTKIFKVKVCLDISKGMEYLHLNNIVHRDLKSDNVLMVSNNPNEAVTVKISDFGTSTLFVDTKSAKKIVDVGTPMYMAPEVHDKSLGNASFKCDVFSFAICLLEIWLTKSPYDPEVFVTQTSIQDFVMSGKRPLIPKDCVYRRLIRKCWAHKPKNRPAFPEITAELESTCQKVIASNMRKRQNTITVLQPFKENSQKANDLAILQTPRVFTFNPNSQQTEGDGLVITNLTSNHPPKESVPHCREENLKSSPSTPRTPNQEYSVVEMNSPQFTPRSAKDTPVDASTSYTPRRMDRKNDEENTLSKDENSYSDVDDYLVKEEKDVKPSENQVPPIQPKTPRYSVRKIEREKLSMDLSNIKCSDSSEYIGKVVLQNKGVSEREKHKPEIKIVITQKTRQVNAPQIIETYKRNIHDDIDNASK